MSPIILDTSAVAAVIFGESDAEAYAAAMVRHAGELSISAVTLVELGIVAEARQGPAATQDVRALLDRLGVVTEPVDAAQAGAALAAWRRFGKGRHPAGLNLGDCFSYALARMSGGSLLFKGNDFAQTDIVGAL
ncbi:type II toxin-antitoxin system VapC family toxin [Nakamurella sp.]|uniref:type II toxin-antitoxin system VapC family toxin n=1 Tax=Nakamurella sp. TaxID=1869182 RepID=UPI00378489C7